MNIRLLSIFLFLNTLLFFKVNGQSITIGNQVWSNKNLDVATYRDGTPIPQVTDPAQWANLTTGAWCYYNNDPALGSIYGKLYNWYAVAGIWNEESKTDVSKRKQLAPVGWHVPTNIEWITLTNFLGGEGPAMGALKEAGTTHWISPNIYFDATMTEKNATNSSGFTGLPGGAVNLDTIAAGRFLYMGQYGFFWSASEIGQGAWHQALYYSYKINYGGGLQKNYGLSIRLVKDDSSISTTPAPTGTSSQTFCSGSTIASLTATGTGIKWYAASTGGIALASTTTLVDGTTYYASQAVNSVESTDRLAVRVSLNNPTISALATTLCSGQSTTLIASSGSSSTSNFSVGSIGPSGGYVFYDKGSDINGWRYLEVTPNDVNSNNSFNLGCYCSEILNTSNSIGAGKTNTTSWSSAGCPTIASTFNYGGFSDWFIPSKDELNLIYQNLKVNNIGNFQNIQYWSSSPANYGSCGINGGAWVQNFLTGTQVSEYRNGYQGSGNIRLVRQFPSGTQLSTYLWSTGETSASITASPKQTTTYWVDVTTNGSTCRKEITITVNSTIAPTGSTLQTLNTGATVANLTASGANIKWYATASGGAELASTAILVNGATYYASQTINVCESSARLAVTVSLNNPSAEPLSSVTIGSQIWTNKNLDVATYRDGTPIPQVTDPTEWKNLTTGAWCYAGNNPDNGVKYGKMYNWYAVAGIWNEASKTDVSKRKQIAPIGWKVPNDTDWTTLINYLGGSTIAGGKMKVAGILEWIPPNTGADNSSGFSALPGGFRHSVDGSFNNYGCGWWWSSTESLIQNQYSSYYRLCASTSSIVNDYTINVVGYSVRLVKDDSSISTTPAPTGTTPQSFCTGATVGDLTATGIGIKWYATINGGTALASGTNLTNGTTYYASQTVNGVESTSRLAVTVNLAKISTIASLTNVSLGSNASLTGSITGATSYQWQSNINDIGWINLPNNTTYLGSNTNRLTINNIKVSNHMQEFRLIATTATCRDTSNVATISVLYTLPVELTTFDATLNKQSEVILNWKTSSELNNSYFTIAKSSDGKNFTDLTRVASQGDGGDYRAMDKNPFSGITYYKLSQTDKDGTTKELGIKAVKISSLSQKRMNVYPNPVVNGIINIQNSSLNGAQDLAIYDLSGKRLITDKVSFLNGTATYQIKETLAKGIYLLQVGDKKQGGQIIVE